MSRLEVFSDLTGSAAVGLSLSLGKDRRAWKAGTLSPETLEQAVLVALFRVCWAHPRSSLPFLTVRTGAIRKQS